MSTQFVAVVPPPGEALKDYDATLPPSKQKPTIPKGFVDAMIIREEVFVQEQNIPLENEFDKDDARSWHWVAYASVGSTSKSTGQPLDDLDSLDESHTQQEAEVRQASASQLPVATLRLVPPPQSPHPVPGSAMVLDPAIGKPLWTMKDGSDYAAAMAAHQKEWKNAKFAEPYVKIGRVATSPPFRRLGLSRLLIASCFEWAKSHPKDILPPMDAAKREAMRLREEMQQGDEGNWKGAEEGWRGLVLVHSQSRMEKIWAKAGFARDEKMGVWWEEGIEHIGMWKRIEVEDDKVY